MNPYPAYATDDGPTMRSDVEGDRPLFGTIWARFGDLELSGDPGLLSCRFAESYDGWASGVLAKVQQKRDVVTVNQAKLLLADKYFQYFQTVPQSHRYHLSPRGHRCVFQAFLEAYKQLKAFELSITPPMIFIPPPPPKPPPPPQIEGIWIGEEIEGEG
ncbi:MAG: hypothetical protein JXA14_17535 [Anaerolineae bacterium]|nr:hypothetical protein [Anaerolineae bacterium]